MQTSLRQFPLQYVITIGFLRGIVSHRTSRQSSVMLVLGLDVVGLAVELQHGREAASEHDERHWQEGQSAEESEDHKQH